jgi:hypothetical protein
MQFSGKAVQLQEVVGDFYPIVRLKTQHIVFPRALYREDQSALRDGSDAGGYEALSRDHLKVAVPGGMGAVAGVPEAGNAIPPWWISTR